MTCICFLSYFTFGAEPATDFAFFFIYPNNGEGLSVDGSDVQFTFTNVTQGCTLTNTSNDVDNIGMLMSCGGAAFVNNCGKTPFIGDEIRFSATILKGPNKGKAISWSGKIELSEYGTSDVTVELEYEVLNFQIQ